MREPDQRRENRVAWIINHATLRRFEIPLLRALGYEVWTSKQLPHRRDFFSATIDHSDDAYSTLPAAALKILNDHNFYEDELTPTVKETLNAHFGTVFCASIGLLIRQLVRHFHGRVLVRAFGLLKPYNYGAAFRMTEGEALINEVRAIGDRFWIAAAYDTIAGAEEPFLRERTVHLPLGLPDDVLAHAGQWTGTEPRLLFVLPRIPLDASPYGLVYSEFKRNFRRLPHVIAGRQHKEIDDPHVTGFVADDVFERWLREFRVIFYHSREPRHLHYHPLEAIAFGMPVLFMRGGLLEHFGGPDQPGACGSFAEARRKASRMLRGDVAFTDRLRKAQPAILAPFRWDFNLDAWRERFADGVMRREVRVRTPTRDVPRRVGVLMAPPIDARAWRQATCLARMLAHGAQAAGRSLEVVVGCPLLDVAAAASDAEPLAAGIRMRELVWTPISRAEAAAAPTIATAAGRYQLREEAFLLPRDGGNDFLDCDLWLLVGHGLTAPLLPLRQCAVFTSAIPHRRYPAGVSNEDWLALSAGFLPTVRRSPCVIAATAAVAADAGSFFGIASRFLTRIAPFYDGPPRLDGRGTVPGSSIVWMRGRRGPPPADERGAVAQALRNPGNSHGVALLEERCTAPLRATLPAARSEAGVRTAPPPLAPGPALPEFALPFPDYLPVLARARALVFDDPADELAFPVVEAAHLSVPLVLADSVYLRELVDTLGADARFFDPRDSWGLATAVGQAFNGTPPPAAAVLEQLHWKNGARRLFDLLEPWISLGEHDAYR